MSAWLELDAEVGIAHRRFSTSTFGSVTSIFAVESYYTDPRAGLE